MGSAVARVVVSSDVLVYALGSPLRMGPRAPLASLLSSNSDMLRVAGNSLRPLATQIVDGCPGHGMKLRPRSGTDHAVSRVKVKGGRDSKVPPSINLTESQGVANFFNHCTSLAV